MILLQPWFGIPVFVVWGSFSQVYPWFEVPFDAGYPWFGVPFWAAIRGLEFPPANVTS